MSATSPSPSGAACSVCGAFAGPLSRCSSCGARIRHRVSLRVFRWMPVLLATVGLALPGTAFQPPELPVAAAPDGAEAPPPAQPAPQDPVAEPVNLADLSAAMTGRAVRVSGRVIRVFAPPAESRAPWRVELEEDGARATIVYWTDVASTLGETVPAVGERWEAKGTVGLYREKLQVQIRNGSDLRRLEAAPAPVSGPPVEANELKPVSAEPVALTGLDQLTLALTGQTVRVTALLGPSRPIRGGVAYALVGGSTNLQVVLWDRIVPAASRASLVEGSEVEITGLVKAFKDRVEIVPQTMGGVSVRSGTPAP